MRRASLHGLHCIGNGYCGRERNQKVKVVLRSSCREQGDTLGSGESGCVGPQALRVADQIGTFLGAEDAVNEVADVGVGHTGRIFPLESVAL